MSVLKVVVVIAKGMKCPLKMAILLALWNFWVHSGFSHEKNGFWQKHALCPRFSL